MVHEHMAVCGADAGELHAVAWWCPFVKDLNYTCQSSESLQLGGGARQVLCGNAQRPPGCRGRNLWDPILVL
jgi:hypothetical protein